MGMGSWEMNIFRWEQLCRKAFFNLWVKDKFTFYDMVVGYLLCWRWYKDPKENPIYFSFDIWDRVSYLRLVSNLLCSWGWLWTSEPPVFTSQVLGLQMCITMPSLCNTVDRTQSFVHSRQALYQPSSILISTEGDLNQNCFFLYI